MSLNLSSEWSTLETRVKERYSLNCERAVLGEIALADHLDRRNLLELNLGHWQAEAINTAQVIVVRVATYDDVHETSKKRSAILCFE